MTKKDLSDKALLKGALLVWVTTFAIAGVGLVLPGLLIVHGVKGSLSLSAVEVLVGMDAILSTIMAVAHMVSTAMEDA